MKSHRHRQCVSLRKLQLSKNYVRQMLGKRRDAQRKQRAKAHKRKNNRTNTLVAPVGVRRRAAQRKSFGFLRWQVAPR